MEHQVYHISHLASRNQDTGGALASDSHRMTDPLGTSNNLVSFFQTESKWVSLSNSRLQIQQAESSRAQNNG